MLGLREGDQRLIGFERTAPVLTPTNLAEKIVSGDLIASHIAVEKWLTFPAEHFHADYGSSTGPQKLIQERQGRFDMKVIVMLLSQVNDLLREQCGHQLLK